MTAVPGILTELTVINIGPTSDTGHLIKSIDLYDLEENPTQFMGGCYVFDSSEFNHMSLKATFAEIPEDAGIDRSDVVCYMQLKGDHTHNPAAAEYLEELRLSSEERVGPELLEPFTETLQLPNSTDFLGIVVYNYFNEQEVSRYTNLIIFDDTRRRVPRSLLPDLYFAQSLNGFDEPLI